MIRRIVATLVVLVAAIVGLVAVWPQLFHLQRTPVIAQIISLRGLALAIVVFLIIVAALLALLSRRLRRLFASLGLVLVVFVAATATVLAMRGIGNTSFPTKAAADITVLSWNTLGDAPGAQEIARLALTADADIVSLPETTNDTATQVARIMAVGGHPMTAYTVHYDLVSKARSTSLLTSVDLGHYQIDTDRRTTNVLPSVVAVPVDGKGPTIVAVHVVAPLPSELNNWKLDLRWLAHACSGPNVIMAGDFNATVDHFSGLETTDSATIGNCFDAGEATGNAAVGTWPTALPELLGAPIDHVMATEGWRISGMRVVGSIDGNGSDHRPIVVQLTPLR